jgi:hypothetical protein
MTANLFQTCFFCGKTQRGLSGLATHVLVCHPDASVTNGKPIKIINSARMKCWCGVECWQETASAFGAKKTFAFHLQEEGGLQQHITNIALGLR